MTKKTKYIIAAIIGVLVIGGAAFVYANSQKETVNDVAAVGPANNETATTATNAQNATTDAQTTGGSYVTLAQYNSDPNKYSEANKVYFFHAGWCPICQRIDKELSDGSTKVPNNTVIIKTDFDSQTDLRKKYGVTYQYTFVQVDSSGNETSQWTASTSSKAIAGIKT